MKGLVIGAGLLLGINALMANGLQSHCEGQFKNTDICIIAKNEHKRQMLEQSGDVYGANTLFEATKTMTMGVASFDSLPGTLRAMEKELKAKRGLKYKGFSYCKGVEPYLWNVLAQMGETNKSLQAQVASVCGK